MKIRKPAPREGLVVQVLAKQFEWNIRYAGPDGRFGTGDDVTMTNGLHVPVDTKVTVLLRSQDVLHSFFLPNIRLKQDTVPGLTISQWFEATKTTEAGRAEFRARLEADRANLGPRVEADLREEIRLRLAKERPPSADLDGEVAKAFAERPIGQRVGDWIEAKAKAFDFEIACAELCGIGHTTMRGTLVVHGKDDFFRWLDGAYVKEVHEYGTDPNALINKHWPADQNGIEDEWLRAGWPADLKAKWPERK